MANLNTGLSAEQVLEAFDRALNDMTDAQVQELVSNSIGALDVSSVGGNGKYIKSISEADGKISATAETMDTEPTSESNKAITSGAVFTALANLITAIMGPGTRIQGTADTPFDLDGLKTSGAFYISSYQDLDNIRNYPSDTDIGNVRANIYVFEFSGTNRCFQIYVPNRTSNAQAFAELYTRSYGSSWSKWRGIYGTQLG